MNIVFTSAPAAADRAPPRAELPARQKQRRISQPGKDVIFCTPMPITLPIAIYYEQPNWFKPLFAELANR